MSVTRSPVLIAVAVSAGLWVLGILLAPAGGGHGAYSVLVCSSTVSDREVRERLENEGFSGLVSESSQRVLLDSFGSIEQIPLDEYDGRVLSFDPRNDGYAQKLRSLFVQNDKRFIYIPQGGGPLVPAVEKRLAAALGDTPYTYYDAQSFGSVKTRKVGLPLLLFFIASLAFFIVSPLRRALWPHAAFLFPLLPVLAPLSLGGSTGFAMASLLAGFAVILAEPCFERLTSSRVLYRQRTPLLVKILPPFLLIGYGALVFFSGLPLVFTLIAFACFCGIFAFSMWGVSRADDAVAAAFKVFGELFSQQQHIEHRRFSPILILKPHIPAFAFSWAMIPFAAAALVMAVVVAITGLSASSVPAASPVLPSPASVTEADYNTHYLFQSRFSETSLHAHESPNAMTPRLNAYELAPDGLSVIPAAMPPKQSPLPNAPPFPLADLLRFLDNPGHTSTVLYEILFMLVPLLFIVSPLIRRRK